ncbi:MAG: hypothetical protein IKR57_03385 [Bacilli bacterium]|nr:hypothetical protein [Bacilli bacterium]
MVSNIKKNKGRIIFWGLVLILCVVLAIIGVKKYEEGYGKTGRARLKLIPIANEFNKQDSIIRYGDITAVVKGSKIVVTYKPEKADKKKFVYEYLEEGNKEIISNTYSSEDVYLGDLVAGGMMDAIYKLHGGTESILATYKFSAFTSTSLENGITVTSGKDTTVKLDINANVIELCSGLDLEKAVTGYITQGDLSSMLDYLEEHKSFRVHKRNITVYIRDNGETYDIFAENLDLNSDDDLYNSLVNVIKLLNDQSLNQIRSAGDRLNKNSKDSLYEVRLNATFTEVDVFNSDSSILRIIIPKPENRK